MRLRRRRGEGASPARYSNASVIETSSAMPVSIGRPRAPGSGELLIFLDMVAESDELMALSQPVDAAWHAFILHTRDHESYCRERYGRTIHHEPEDAPDPAACRRSYERRRRRRGGRPDGAIWVPSEGALYASDGGGDTADWGGSVQGGGASCGGSGCGGNGG